MKYNDAINYLYNLQKHGIKLGLDNMKAILHVLDNPQDSFKSIHIAGTNGKGSTAAMIHSLLKEDGHVTGLFTSPHMVRFTERIRINSVEISKDEVTSLTTEIKKKTDAIKGLSPTYFEMVTALAIYYFKKSGAKWAVFETGMGGRFDATNILIPELTLITPISEDHKEYLGNTLKEIAFEKAGIIKKNTPLIIATQKNGITAILSDTAEKENAEIYIYNKDFTTEIIDSGIHGSVFNYSGKNRFNELELPLPGIHQIENAASAIKAFEVLAEKRTLRTNNIPGATVAALKKFKWPGRLELTEYKGMKILIDGAHNYEAINRLVDTVRKQYVKTLKISRAIFITGIMADKDIPSMVGAIAKEADLIIFTKPNFSRAEKPGNLMSIAGKINPHISCIATNSTSEALEAAEKMNKKGDLFIITGSFYTVGEAKEIMGEDTLLKDLAEFR